MREADKPVPVPSPVEVTVNGAKVTVTLMLKPGTTVTRVGDDRHQNHVRSLMVGAVRKLVIGISALKFTCRRLPHI